MRSLSLSRTEVISAIRTPYDRPRFYHERNLARAHLLNHELQRLAVQIAIHLEFIRHRDPI